MSGLDGASIGFILFGLLAALASRLRVETGWRIGILLGTSVLFLLLLDARPVALLPLGGFLVAGYGAIVAVRRGVRQEQAIAVLGIIAAYAWLKQYSFLPTAGFLPFAYLTLGLSYIFFRVLHLVIEAGSPGPAREIGPLRYLAYTLNFTTFISGPIQRFEDFDGRLRGAPEPMTGAILGVQIERLILGFFKVNVLGLLFSMIQVDALAELARGGTWGGKAFAAWRLVGSYPFFLYCNFSGYIDIVIAIARLMGLRLPENFDRPFSATSFIDFWNRWHITLSTWLKTYVYNPLMIGLVRRFPDGRFDQAFGVLAFFVTFFLIGIWHGRTSEYAVFGLLQGGGVAINKLWQLTLAKRLGKKRYRALAARPLYAIAARGLTFAWFAFSLLWFWGSWGQIGTAFAEAGAAGWTVALVALWLVAAIGLEAWERVRAAALEPTLGGEALLRHRYARTAFVTILAAITFLMTAVLSQPAPGIVYRTF